MAEIKDGGSAFPVSPSPSTTGAVYGGLTVRDWFAGMALQGVLASPMDLIRFAKENHTTPIKAAVAAAWDAADAMIAHREQKP